MDCSRSMILTKRSVRKWIISWFLGGLFALMLFISNRIDSLNSDYSIKTEVTDPDKYVVYSCSTPSDTLRSFDYAFYLPLTAFAWERLGFKSFIALIGNRSEWEEHLVLAHVLYYLSQRNATFIFMNAPLAQRVTVSQIVRVLASNLNEFPGNDDDYLVTGDADLWPLQASLVNLPPPGPGEENYDLLLTHPNCCGNFSHRGQDYRMLPMSYIGARVSIWKEILKMDHPPDRIETSEQILKYFENEFGDGVRLPDVERDSNQWYNDQFMISLRIHEWLSLSTKRRVLEVSTGETFQRLDRYKWEYFPDYHEARKTFNEYEDAHLPLSGYKTFPWFSFRVLLRLMYKDDKKTINWANQYASLFRQKMIQLKLI